MRILCVIDHFGSGGAQRQMAELACGLKGRGHDVEAFSYFPQHDFFLPRVAARQIVVHRYSKPEGTRTGLLRALRGIILRGGYDLVISYMNTPNLYAEICTLMSGPTRLVVSERCTHHEDPSWLRSLARRGLHAVADLVVTNSVTHKEWLERYPWLRRKVSCVYNGLDLDEFRPRGPALAAGGLRMLAIGRVSQQKNLLGLAQACGIFYRRHGWAPAISWVGRYDGTAVDRQYLSAVKREIDRHPQVAAQWSWLGERRDVPDLLAAHDALILPSLYEGLPNAVCEALASGRPVLASAVCDNARLVAHGERGIIFDPLDSAAIAAAMFDFASLSQQDRERMGRNARRYAEETLSIQRMVDEYERLFDRLTGNREYCADVPERF